VQKNLSIFPSVLIDQFFGNSSCLPLPVLQSPPLAQKPSYSSSIGASSRLLAVQTGHAVFRFGRGVWFFLLLLLLSLYLGFAPVLFPLSMNRTPLTKDVYMHAHVHIHVHIRTLYMHIHVIRTHTHTLSFSLSLSLPLSHTRMHTHMHTSREQQIRVSHTYTYTLTFSLCLSLSLSLSLSICLSLSRSLSFLHTHTHAHTPEIESSSLLYKRTRRAAQRYAQILQDNTGQQNQNNSKLSSKTGPTV